MKSKPRWMKSLLKTVDKNAPKAPIGRQAKKLERRAIAKPA